jgi:hypothetical protein
MKSPIKNTLAVMLAVAICTAFLLTGCEERAPSDPPERIELLYFYNGACASCNDLREFQELVYEELAGVDDQYPYFIVPYNVFTLDGMAARDEIFPKLGIEKELLTYIPYPVLIMNGNIYSGTEGIRAALREAYLTAGEDFFVYKKSVFDPTKPFSLKKELAQYKTDPKHSTVVYFYKATCEECMRVSNEILPKMPATVTIDGTQTQQDIVKINISSGRNAEIIRVFDIAYDVPVSDQITPIIFTAQGYLAGYDAIASSLISSLESGAGVGFQMPKGE